VSLLPRSKTLHPDLEAVQIIRSGEQLGKLNVTFFPDRIKKEQLGCVDVKSIDSTDEHVYFMRDYFKDEQIIVAQWTATIIWCRYHFYNFIGGLFTEE